jgi:hypothetical protein
MTDEDITYLYWATSQRYNPAANHIAVIIAFARAVLALAEQEKKDERT